MGWNVNKYATYYSDICDQRTCVYRLYDEDDQLLYVGMSLRPGHRLLKHKATTWGKRIAYLDVEWFDDREAAKRAERSAIHHEVPLHNLVRPRMECC